MKRYMNRRLLSFSRTLFVLGANDDNKALVIGVATGASVAVLIIIAVIVIIAVVLYRKR